jgi:outer membrane receptor protein involved in Fe transport
MFNKKITWLGLVAILTVLPILVANPPETPRPAGILPPLELPANDRDMPRRLQLGPPVNATDPAPRVGPRSNEPAPLVPSPFQNAPAPNRGAAPYLPAKSESPYFGVPLAGFQPDEKKDPKKEPKEVKEPTPVQPTPPTQTAALPSIARLPSVASAPSDAPPSPAPERNVTPTAAPAAGVGNVLADSNSALGVEIQRRSPLVGDPRIQGLHFGQIVTQADGGYWFPVRIDLDTVVSKLNSTDIKNILIIQGPFSVRYGPGFSFLDIESIGTPRSTTGMFDAHGSTSLSHRTNRQGWQGQQSFWGGNTDWGFRLSYDIQSAGDYRAGNGDLIPGRYNNQFVNFAYGVDFTKDCSLELRYLHVQQTGVLLPGLLTGVNSLVSDAFTGRLVAKNGCFYDRQIVDVWVNNSTFGGDSSNPATRAQVPQLDEIFTVEVRQRDGQTFPGGGSGSSFFPVRLDITTEGNALSWGIREITTWGDPKGFNLSLGADFRMFVSNYNEFDAFNFSVINGTSNAANLGIPGARQVDPGILLDSTIPLGDSWLFKVGTRVDWVTNQFLTFGPNVDQETYIKTVGDPRGDRSYFLFAGFLSGEYKLTDEWTAQGGYGYAQRAPTLTELYSGGAFLGQIQSGLNSIYGFNNLRKEEMHQLSAGLHGKYDDVRLGGSAYYAWIPNYITYRTLGLFTVDLGGFGVGTTPIQQLQFMNTRSATLWGADAYGEFDATPWLTPFATVSYVQGWDQTRAEALPGIAPLSGRVGLRFHESGQNPRWGLEYYARIVAPQDLFAESLGEQRTGGFAVHNIRGYWQATDNFLLLAGVENIGDIYYREHLDLRTGRSVFQPGINFYVGMKLTY